MVKLDDIVAAAKRIDGHAVKTPLLTSDKLNTELGFKLWVKAEPLQRTGSFKFRGAMNAISSLPDDGLPVLVFSSGNHAQGIALAAQIKGRKATIIMPKDAPQVKIENTKSYGAAVILYDRYTEDREAVARKHLEKGTHAHLIPPFDDESVIAGQGTIGLEIAEQAALAGFTPDTAIICCGGGGLISGSSIALKNAFPNVDIFSAEPAGFDDMARSLEHGHIVANAAGPRSICDAIVTPQPGNITFPICQELVAGGKVVSDTEVLKAMKTAFHYFKLIVEPGGCVALAAALQPEFQAEGTNVVVVASGGNLDHDMLEAALKA